MTRGPAPLFSVLIPTRDRPGQLERCVASLSASAEVPGGFEVIVVDDGGSVDLEPILSPHRQRLDLTLLRRPHSGPGPARNAGAEHARGKMLALTDDDMLVEPGWLRALAERAADEPGAAIGGRTLNAHPANRYSRVSQWISDRAHNHHNEGPEGPSFFASNNLAVPADRYRDLGGFDPAFRTSEDRDFCGRWHESGAPMVDAKNAVAWHARELDLASFWRQHFGYGRGAFAYHRARRARGVRVRGDFQASFHLQAARETARHSKRSPGDALLILLWQLANTAGFLREALAALNPRGPRSRALRRAETA
ncbi:MAG: glycosyltransferase family 2 protein [Solirubrobacterales bacterium]